MIVEGTTGLKEVLKMTAQQWREIGLKIKRWRAEDFASGLFQNGRKGFTYSDDYGRYKANDMKRFTEGGKHKDYDPSQDYVGKRIYGKTSPTSEGGRLMRYRSKALNTQASYVDMRLTGKLIDSERVLSSTPTSVTYLVADNTDRNAQKVMGNARHGYEMRGLNDKNILKVKDEIIGLMDENIRKSLGKELKITVRG